MKIGSEEQEKDRPGKVFVGGLVSELTEEDLEQKFSVYGRLTEGKLVHVV